MTAEEIIERLIDNKSISAKEAIVLIKAIFGIIKEDVKNNVKEKLNIPVDPTLWKGRNIVEAYGVRTPPMAEPYGVQTYPEYNRAGDYITTSSVAYSSTEEITGDTK